jgi:transposase InsO family protein
MVKVVSLAKSTFYYWDKNRDAPDKHLRVKNRIAQLYSRHKGRYGYRRIAAALQAEGEKIHQNTVQRLMGQLGLKSTQRVKRYKSYRGEIGRTAPNELDRKFSAPNPNEKWVTDITEFKVGDQKLYFSPIKDLFNGEIITYTMSSNQGIELVNSMVKQGLKKLRPKDRPLLHSDQGWQYQMPGYRKLLEDRELVQSMSRKGNCYDNASMESFFAVLKTECFHTTKFRNIDELKEELVAYVRYYNRDRLSLGLDGLSPVQYRLRHAREA